MQLYFAERVSGFGILNGKSLQPFDPGRGCSQHQSHYAKDLVVLHVEDVCLYVLHLLDIVGHARSQNRNYPMSISVL